MPLPDIDQESWSAYSSDLFKQQNQTRIDALNFASSNRARIDALGQEIPEQSFIPRGGAPTTIGGQIPIPLPPQIPQMPGPMPAPGPAPVPPQLPPVAPPIPTPGPVAPTPPAPPVFAPLPQPPVAVPPPAVQPPTRPPGAVLPELPTLPEGPGPGSTAPAPARPSVWAPSQATPSIFAEPPGRTAGAQGVDTSSAAMVAVNSAAPGEYQNYARQAAVNAGIDPSLFMAQIQQESGFNPNAGSPAGAQGIAQIVPRFHPGVNPADPYASLDYAASMMRRLLDQYGGDWEHALVAYNGGTGAVAAWDSGKPYGESRTYVDRILGQGRPNQTATGPAAAAVPAPGTAARPAATAMSTSQFGDRELTASEAYAACGPAAAVRFLQAYGRNPTLREAVDLASEVGWTEQQGMAGIGSEQRLMQKLGLDTRVVSGPQWQQFAQEAQTGNPVVISTPGHYFYADGFNPQTGAFHVGRSGLDLRQGKEWMTPAEIEGLMGPAQGALFANNPSVASSSQVATPTATLDDTRVAALNRLGGAPRPTGQINTLPTAAMPNDPQVRALDRAVEMAYVPETRMTPMDELSRRRDALNQTVDQQIAASENPSPLDNLGSLIGNAIQGALQSVLGGAGGPPGGPRRPAPPPQQDEQQSGTEPTDLRDLSSLDPVLSSSSVDRTRAMIERMKQLPGGLTLRNLGVPDLEPIDTRNLSPSEAVIEAARRAGEDVLQRQLPTPGPGGLGIFDPRLGSDPRMDIPDLIEPIGHAAGAITDVLGRITGRSARAERAAATALETAYELGRGFETPGGGGVVAGIADRGVRSAADGLSRSAPKRAYDAFVRNYSDRQVDLNHVEEELARRLKRPLTDSERVGLLNRLDPTHQAETAVEMAIGPAVRAVPDHAQDDLVNLVKLRTMQSIAEGKGKIAEREFLQGGIAQSTERRLDEALNDLRDAQQAWAQAHSEALMVERGAARTRGSISIDASKRRISDAAARLEAATEAARQAQAESAAEAVRSGPGAQLVTDVQQRDLIIAESDVQRLNEQYDKLYARNPDDPYLNRLARQISRAENRLSRLRTDTATTSVAREQAVALRAEEAAQVAGGWEPGRAPPLRKTADVASQEVRLRFEQQNLERLQKQQAAGMQGLADDVARAQKRADKAQADLDQAVADMPAAAKAQGYAAMTGRIFEGGRQYDDIMAELAALENKYRANPEAWGRMNEADQAIQDFRRQMLQEKVDAGVIDQATMDSLMDTYTHWTPTRLLDYMTDEGPTGLPRGNRVNVDSNGFRSYTDEGSDLEMENPIASMIREADQHYGRVGKNQVFNALVNAQGGEGGALRRIADSVREYVDAGGRDGRLLHPDYKPKVGKGEQKIVGFVNGKKQEFITDNPYLKQAVENVGAGDASLLARMLQSGAGLVRQVAVSRNPLWLAGNSARDAATYAIRSTAQGGPKVLPSMALNIGPAALVAANTSEDDPYRGQKIAAALFAGMGTRVGLGRNLGLGPSATREFLRAYADVLQGLGSGRMTGGGVRELNLGGGGMRGGGMFAGSPVQAEEALRRLTRRNAFQIRNGADLKQLLNDVAAFGWVSALGNRFEQAPRVAMMRLARARGESPLQAVIRARDASIDFDRGGNLSREVNRFIPFFNAGAQAGAQFTRLAKSDPLGLAFAGSMLVGFPTAAMEAWNLSDPQRARDYADVPDYLKRQGPVLMMPGEAPIDANGNRVPQHFDFNLQEFAPFAIAGREAYRRITGRGEPSSAGEVAGDLLQQFSPLQARSPVEAIYGVVPPPAGTIAQLGLNQDLFRGSTIANQYSDENASNLGKALAPVIENIVTGVPGWQTAHIHPSQVDFAIRDTLSGLGSMGLNISDALTGRAPRATGAPSDIPVVGSGVGRFVRGTGGQSWEDVRRPEQMMEQDVRSRLRSFGDYYEPSAVQDAITIGRGAKVPLRRVEQVEYQRLVNQYFNEFMRDAMDSPAFTDSDARDMLRARMMAGAREIAAREVLQQVDASGGDIGRRIEMQSSAY